MHELLDGRRVGVLSAHPDDHLIHAQALTMARGLALATRELILTRGEATANNFRGGEFDPAAGNRTTQENLPACEQLGIQYDPESDVLDGTDGNLEKEADKLWPRVLHWLDENNIDTLLTLGFRDHPDHFASGVIGQWAVAHSKRRIDVAELQPHAPGDLLAPTTPEGIRAAMETGICHGSQFKIARGAVQGWKSVEGYSLDQKTFAELGIYPIWHDASYNLYPASNLQAAHLAGAVALAATNR